MATRKTTEELTRDQLARLVRDRFTGLSAELMCRMVEELLCRMRIPRQPDHRFHGKLDSHSTAKWTLIPAQTGQ